MKIHVNKQLGVVLMLLAMCSLFLASGCEPDPWESWRAKGLDSDYIGVYEVTEVYGHDGELVDQGDSDGGDVEVKKAHFMALGGGEEVHLDNGVYYFPTSLYTIEIKKLEETLDTLERCKQVQKTYEDKLLPGLYDAEGCGEYAPPRYRERGVWGFPGGEKNYNVKYNFYGGNKMDMAFTDSKDPSRNFRLVCKRKS